MPGNFLNPKKLIDQLDLKEDMIAAEFGCGSGGFTIPLAKRLEKGKVYALDIQQEPLSALKGKASMERLTNIETRRCDLEEEKGSQFPPDFLDLVLIPNVLFQSENEKEILKEAERVTKKGGKILVVDWKKGADFGPKEGRVSLEDVEEAIEDLRLDLKDEADAGKYHWAVILDKGGYPQKKN